MNLFQVFVEKKKKDFALGTEFLFKGSPVFSAPEKKGKTVIKIIVKHPFPLPDEEVVVPGITTFVKEEERKLKDKRLRLLVYEFDPLCFLSEFTIFLKRYENFYFKVKRALKYEDSVENVRKEELKKLISLMETFDQFMVYAFYNMGYFAVYDLEEYRDLKEYIKKAHVQMTEEIEFFRKICCV